MVIMRADDPGKGTLSGPSWPALMEHLCSGEEQLAMGKVVVTTMGSVHGGHLGQTPSHQHIGTLVEELAGP